MVIDWQLVVYLVAIDAELGVTGVFSYRVIRCRRYGQRPKLCRLAMLYALACYNLVQIGPTAHPLDLISIALKIIGYG